MSKSEQGFILGIGMTLFFIAFPLMMALSGARSERDDLKREALARHYAEYNPTNAVFQWKDR